MTDNCETILAKINALLDVLRADPGPIESTDFVSFAEACVERIVKLIHERDSLLAIQPCGHPAAAIRHGSGNPTTNYCGWCADIDGALDAGRKEARRVVVPVFDYKTANAAYWLCDCGAFVRRHHFWCWSCGARLDWSEE